MSKLKPIKLKKIVPYLFWLDNIRIYQGDVKVNFDPNDDDIFEEIYYGSVMDIPWYLMDYYLVNDKNGESISINDDKDFIISVVEEKKSLKKFKYH